MGSGAELVGGDEVGDGLVMDYGCGYFLELMGQRRVLYVEHPPQNVLLVLRLQILGGR